MISENVYFLKSPLLITIEVIAKAGYLIVMKFSISKVNFNRIT